MQLAEYQEKAVTFKRYDYTAYLEWAVKAESGELQGVWARIFRGDEGDHESDLVKECGDILWVLTLMHHELGRNISENYVDKMTKIEPQKASDWIYRLAPFISDQFSKKDVDDISIQVMLRYLEKACGYSIGEIAQTNIDKLESRRVRNVLRGKGDDR